MDTETAYLVLGLLSLLLTCAGIAVGFAAGQRWNDQTPPGRRRARNSRHTQPEPQDAPPVVARGTARAPYPPLDLAALPKPFPQNADTENWRRASREDAGLPRWLNAETVLGPRVSADDTARIPRVPRTGA